MAKKPYLKPPLYRSIWMAKVRAKGNLSTEIAFMRLLRKSRLSGWRRHQRLPGTPDFVFFKERLAIFLDGDFWHGNPQKYKTPKTNSRFWDSKIQRNRIRDRVVNRQLKSKGYRVIRIWESSLKKDPAKWMKKIFSTLRPATKLPIILVASKSIRANKRKNTD